MALTLGDNFSYQGAKPLDARLTYDTVASMKAVADSTMYEGCTAYCIATEKTYQWKSTNTVDETLGKWREFNSGGGSGGTTDYSDLENKPSIENVTLSGNKTASDLGLEKAVELTQAQYNALSQEEKMNGTAYYITDGEGGGSYSVLSATLQAGSTTVSFTVPTSGNYLLDVYTSDGRNYTDVDTSTSGTVALTFNAPQTDVTVYLEVKGV